MNIIITMAGLGTRFSKEGYRVPKFMIEANGKTLFEWSMNSLIGYNEKVKKYIFIVRKECSACNFIINKMNALGVSNIEIIEIDYLTDGQASTALIGTKSCLDDEPILIFNIDTYVEQGALRYCDLKGDGFIPCFKSSGDHWSFVKEENGRVVEVAEKKRISDNCSLGVYYFKTARLFQEMYQELYCNTNDAGERYIAPIYDYMIKKGYQVYYNVVESNKVHILGTPSELQVFINSYKGY